MKRKKDRWRDRNRDHTSVCHKSHNSIRQPGETVASSALSLSLVIRLRCVGTTFWLSLRCSSIIITTLAMVVIIEHAQRTKSSCVVPNGNVSEI